MIRLWKQDKLLLGAILLTILWMGLFLFGSQLAPFDPNETNLGARLQDISATHLLGTDQLGRDVLSRILWGGQDSLFIAISIIAISSIIGICIGGLLSMSPWYIDELGSRCIDMVLGFPSMIVAIACIGILGPSVENIIISLCLTCWAEYAKITRNLVNLEKQAQYVVVARMSGASLWRIIRRYMIPNVRGTLLLVIIQHMGDTIITVASFSLIGIGVQPPTPEWGAILLNARDFLQTAPWLLIYPGLAIFITVVLLNYISDALQDGRHV